MTDPLRDTSTNMTVAEMVERRHTLKVWPAWFRELREGRKRFEIRENDRGFRIGDVLDLREFDPGPCPYPDTGIIGPTGERLEARVTSILHGGRFGLADGFVCMSIEVVDRAG